MAGACEDDTEPSGCIKGEEFLDYLSGFSRRHLLHGITYLLTYLLTFLKALTVLRGPFGLP